MVRLMPRDFMCPLRRIMDVANYLEPYGVATGAVLEWICISQNFNDRRAQPRGFVRQPLKQESRSASQSGPIKVGTAGVATCWVPIVGGGPPVPRSLTHVSNKARQMVEHPPCTILFFGMGVKLPARLA